MSARRVRARHHRGIGRAWPLALLCALGCAPARSATPDAAVRRDVVTPRDAALAEPACEPAPRCPTAPLEDLTPLDAVPQFARLQEILRGPDEAVDVAEVSLRMSQLLDDALEPDADLARLDALAAEFRRALPRACVGRCALRALVRMFLGRWRFRAVVDPNGLYVDARYDLLHDVLASREGYCEGLSVAFLAVGQRAGLPLRGVLARQHVYVRYDGADGVVDVDLTREGRAPEPDPPLPRCAPRPGVYNRALGGREMAAQVVSVVGILDGIESRRAWIDLAVQLAPNDPDLRNNRGADREARYDFEGAAADYRAAASIDPCVAFYRVNLAGALRRAGRLDEAGAALDAVERDAREGALEDDALYVSLARGDLALARGDDALAERYYLVAARAAPEAPVPWESLGRLRMLRGEHRGAAEAVLAAMEREPTAGQRLSLAEALLRAGDPAWSRELSRAERDDADVDEVSWVRALAAAAQGRPQEARERALRCLERLGPSCLEATILMGDTAASARCAAGWYALSSTCPLPPRDRERARVTSLAAERLRRLRRAPP
jgi:tetratricopeptide (TPR) repeat protein